MPRILSSLLLLFAAASYAQESGTVAGSVFDASTGQPVRGARIQISGQSASNLTTDTDGKYQIRLRPGTYKLTFQADNYADSTVDEVIIKANEVTDASTVMANKNAVTTVEVKESVGVVQANAEAMLAERKLSAAVSDALSRDEIRKTVASDAAGAVEKVTGVSVVDSGYVYVRGLGERYSATMLNNAVLPTTEPERRVVPLDLFPAALIDSIKVLKTYTPDLPGEFSGGLVQMSTTEFPTKPLLKVGVSYGFNTATTFGQFRSYPGGGRDFFGFDDGNRNLPSGIPSNGRVSIGAFNAARTQEFGRAFSDNWEPSVRDSMRPSQTYNVVGGNTYGRFGVVGAITFTNSPQRYSELQRYLTLGSGNRPEVFSDYPSYVSDAESVRLGAVLNIAARLNASNKLVFRNALTRDTDKEARVFSGLYGSNNVDIQATRLRWIERGLLSSSLEGEHSVARAANSLFRWQFTYSSSTRNEPDLRENIRVPFGNDQFRWSPLPNSGLRFFSGLGDKIYEPQAEWTTPFFKGGLTGLLKFGFRSTVRRRDFSSRRFRYVPNRPPANILVLPSNQLFSQDNIRPDYFSLVEFTRATDAYNAGMDIYGGYAMVDLNLTPKLRLVGGVRIEDAKINVITVDPLVPGGQPTNSTLNNRDALPGFNLIYALSPRQNIRFGYGRTVSRPDFRELSPFEFLNTLGGFSVNGNPNLKRARIDNFDARWEWFPGGDQVIAASFFYKKFTDPIEIYIQPTTGDLRQSFFNAAGANNYGVELEFRRSLAFVNPKMRPFALVTNFTVVSSDVDLSGSNPLLALLTSRNRPLVGQSRYIANVILDWTQPKWRSNARFFVNTVSRRLTDVGTFGLPDVYQERNLFLDFSYEYSLVESGKWNLRFAAENLGNNDYRWRQADILVRNYRLGRTFSVGTSYSF